MEHKELTPTESLNVIHEMISGAKARMKENGFIYLFWGWLILICALAQFILLNTGYEAVNFYPYFLVIPAAIYTFFKEKNRHRRQGSSNYISLIMMAVWVTAGINLLLTGFLFSAALQTSPVPFILVILALATIAAGAVLQFRPLIVGGIICNAAGIIAVFLPFGWHPLLLAVAIVAADLIPGYILRKQFKQYHAKEA